MIDGGILAKGDNGRLIHATWSIHTISPSRACMVCLGALPLGAIALDRGGKLDDLAYINGLALISIRSSRGRTSVPSV